MNKYIKINSGINIIIHVSDSDSYICSPSAHSSWHLSPHQYLFRDNPVSKKFKQPKNTAICWEILCSKIQNKDHRVKLLQMEIGTKTRVKRGTSSVDLYSMTEHL